LHIWYIHPYGGGPGLGLYDRPWQLARAWQQQGHTATIFIAAFHHLLEQGVTAEPDFEIDGISYVGVPARAYSGNGPARMLNMLGFTKNLYATGVRFGRDLPTPDVVIASSPHPFTIFPAHRLARRHGARLVLEVRDIWPLSITAILGTSRLHPLVQMCSLAEQFALTRSDLVASPLPRMDRYLSDRGFGDKPCIWVPNGVGIPDPTASVELVSDEARAAQRQLDIWRSQGRVNIIYTGAIGKPNALDLLVEAVIYARSIGGDRNIGVLIVGRGDELMRLRSVASENQIENVYFSGSVPKADAIKLLKDADIGYAGLRNIENLFGYGISPNKIASYLSASLPVLLPIAPCGDPVSESGGGIARRMDTPEELWNALRELVGLSPQERRLIGEKGKSYIAREYDYAQIAARYIEGITALN
jgi:glycosyltransferase involved in cell wall biosynthesis